MVVKWVWGEREGEGERGREERVYAVGGVWVCRGAGVGRERERGREREIEGERGRERDIKVQESKKISIACNSLSLFLSLTHTRTTYSSQLSPKSTNRYKRRTSHTLGNLYLQLSKVP